ncbi:MAG: DUF3667 domain-containing protein [Saprospiraceae bacterium]|nr:DUF3667 domain-containing protein [Saprospiraceae bacterium]
MHCKTCQTPLEGLYCHNCGQKTLTGHITVKSLTASLFHIITNLEQGFTYTLIALFTRPGQVIREYLEGATRRYYHPLRYLLVLSGFAVLMAATIDMEKILMQSSQFTGVALTPEAVEMQKKTYEVMVKYMSLVYVALIPIMSLGSYFIFKRYKFNYAEHMVANSYLYGQLSLLSLVTVNLYRIPDWISIGGVISFFATLLLSAWFYKSWFGLGWLRAVVLTIIALLLSYVFIGLFASVFSIFFAVG